jgi:hypothetical protein
MGDAMAIFKSTPKKPSDPFEAIPVGEVVEGNSEADWSEWEDSVAFQDSQQPGLKAQTWDADRRAKESNNKIADTGDAFSSVTKNSS